MRIDYMFDAPTGGLYITEINTIPGSLAFYLWSESGVKYTALIDRYGGVCHARRMRKRTAAITRFRPISSRKRRLGRSKARNISKGSHTLELSKIKNPTDILNLTTDECKQLAKEIRETIITHRVRKRRAPVLQPGRGGDDHRAAPRVSYAAGPDRVRRRSSSPTRTSC